MKALDTLLVVTLIGSLIGCVTNREIPTVKPTDYDLTCNMLKFQLQELGVEFTLAKSDSGLSGENVAMAVVFWPGIIVNEMRANRNAESVQRRIDHLSSLYSSKCVKSENEESASEDEASPN